MKLFRRGRPAPTYLRGGAGLACVLGTAWLALCAPAAAGAQSGGGPLLAGAPTGISVRGAQLENDGVPWTPRGVQIVGLVAPDGALWGKYVGANQHYGEPELAQARADGADLVRFQVSEFGLDPDSSLYSPAYLQEVVQAVTQARSLGLNVIVSLQAEPPAGEARRCPLPDAGAERAWLALAPYLAGDPNVMLELYNEPAVGPTAAGWQSWLDGGTVSQSGGSSCQAVGMQPLIDAIRGAGADNVIVVPGASEEGTLNGMPQLLDPADLASPQFVYGIHYPATNGSVSTWNRKFGSFAAGHPVIITEWNENSTTNCAPRAPAEAPFLLSYLLSRQIGVVGFAFDLPGTIVADWNYTPTSYSGFACGTPNGGAGQVLLGEFAGLAQATVPNSAGVTPPHSDPAAWIVSMQALRRLALRAPGLTQQFFDSPLSFVTSGRAAALVKAGFPAALPTASFTSERALAAAIRGGHLPAGTRAVMFDDEAGSRTPRAEQLHPGIYYQRAEQVAHAADLLLVGAPELNLARVVAPRTRPGRLESEFLRHGIARDAARYADVYAIQGQAEVGSARKYRAFVRAATAQATAVHRGVELTGALSTNRSGRSQTASNLLRAATSVRALVSGYRLEDPGPGFPRVAVNFLRKLRSTF